MLGLYDRFFLLALSGAASELKSMSLEEIIFLFVFACTIRGLGGGHLPLAYI